MVGIEFAMVQHLTPYIKKVHTRNCSFNIFCKQNGKLDYSRKRQVSLLPVRASEQGNVIGSVRIYIYIYVCVYKKNCN